MLNITKKIVTEPLLHFLFLGALAYLYFDYSNETQSSVTKPELSIELYQLNTLKKETNIQDSKLALAYLKYQKILLAEAYSLELYKEDTKINQLLLSKMEYLFKSDTQFAEPSEEQLKQFYNEHISDYSHIKAYDLYALKLPKSTDKKAFQKLSIISDLRPLAKKYEAITPVQLQEKFGKYTALKLSTLAQGYWSETITNGENNFLFLIEKKEVEKAYPFEELEGSVYENYKRTLAVENEKREYAKLYNKYSFTEQK